jgi:hypothetical protein
MGTHVERPGTDHNHPDHPYDDPNLDSLEFLSAVRRSTTVPLSLRIEAAMALIPYESPRQGTQWVQTLFPAGDSEHTLTIRIPTINDPAQGSA